VGELESYNSKLKHSKSLSRPSLDLLITNEGYPGSSNHLNSNSINPNMMHLAPGSNLMNPVAANSPRSNPMYGLTAKSQLDIKSSNMTDSINMKESQIFANKSDLFTINEITPNEDLIDEDTRRRDQSSSTAREQSSSKIGAQSTTPKQVKKTNVLPKNYRLDLLQLSKFKKSSDISPLVLQTSRSTPSLEEKNKDSDSNSAKAILKMFDRDWLMEKSIMGFDEIKEEEPLILNKIENSIKIENSTPTPTTLGEKRAAESKSHSDSRETVTHRPTLTHRMTSSSRMMKMSGSSRFMDKSTMSIDLEDAFSKLDLNTYSLVTEYEKVDFEIAEGKMNSTSGELSEERKFLNMTPTLKANSPRRRST
jgi:hypothetical protein